MPRKSLFILILLKASCTTYEEPNYTLLDKKKEFEIRKYLPQLVAEVELQNSFEKAGSDGFRILANFIFGNNKEKKKIAMTAPVDMISVSKKDLLKMKKSTVIITNKNRYKVRFTMPRKYSLNSLPTPWNEKVKIFEEKEKILAVRKYSGSWSKENFEKEKKLLIDELRKHKILFENETIFSRYNSPYTLWFLRRNEVKILLK